MQMSKQSHDLKHRVRDLLVDVGDIPLSVLLDLLDDPRYSPKTVKEMFDSVRAEMSREKNSVPKDKA